MDSKWLLLSLFFSPLSLFLGRINKVLKTNRKKEVLLTELSKKRRMTSWMGGIIFLKEEYTMLNGEISR